MKQLLSQRGLDRRELPEHQVLDEPPQLGQRLHVVAGLVRDAGLHLAETLTVPAGTTIHWFSVDSAGNIEGNYDPSSSASNYSKTTVG
jgi:hypothetical protein